MNKKPRVFVLCFPHLGMLDNWLPVVSGMNDIENNINFTLIIPDAMIIRNFHKDNAVVKISNSIFDTVLIRAYDRTWIEHTTVFDSIKWYQNNRIGLRLFDILKRLIKRRTLFLILLWPLILLRNKIYKKESRVEHEKLDSIISKADIMLFDMHVKNNPFLFDIMQLFENNKKYSLPHALSMPISEDLSVNINNKNNINNKDNIEAYVYADFQSRYYHAKYGIDKNKFHIVGIPRHDRKWVKKIQEESCGLPDNFNNNKSILILSRHVDGHISFDEKVGSIKNIKKIFIDRLGMKIIVKQHPSEKQQRIFAKKYETIYEDIFGLDNYGVTWIYSDLHVIALGKNIKLAFSLTTGVVFDLIAIGTPCVEYIDQSVRLKNFEKRLTEYVEYGFVEGVSNIRELEAFVSRWSSNPDQIPMLSIKTYKKYLPIINNTSRKIANKILIESKIT